MTMNYAKHPAHHTVAKSQRGVTLMELLIAAVVLALLMAGLSELVITNSRNATATGTLARLEETGRTAIQLLSADIRRAGYYGGNVVVGSIGGTSGVAESVGLCTDAVNDSTWARALGEPLFGVNDPDPATGYGCVIALDLLRGDVLTLRHTPAARVLTIDPVVDAQKLFLRTTPVEGKVFQGEQTLNPDNLLATLTARDYEIVAHTYYVGPSGRSCNGDAIPALFRKVIHPVSNRPVSQELLAGVENMHFRYLVPGAAINRYFTADQVVNWATVTAVEMQILVRAECPETGFTNTRPFTFDGADYCPTDDDPCPNDGFRRQLFTNLTQLRN